MLGVFAVRAALALVPVRLVLAVGVTFVEIIGMSAVLHCCVAAA